MSAFAPTDTWEVEVDARVGVGAGVDLGVGVGTGAGLAVGAGVEVVVETAVGMASGFEKSMLTTPGAGAGAGGAGDWALGGGAELGCVKGSSALGSGVADGVDGGADGEGAADSRRGTTMSGVLPGFVVALNCWAPAPALSPRGGATAFDPITITVAVAAVVTPTSRVAAKTVLAEVPTATEGR